MEEGDGESGTIDEAVDVAVAVLDERDVQSIEDRAKILINFLLF